MSKLAAILKFFNDISRMESQIELKLDGRYRGDMEIQNCAIRSASIYKMATILKFFQRHLPNGKSDLADMEIQNC